MLGEHGATEPPTAISSGHASATKVRFSFNRFCKSCNPSELVRCRGFAEVSCSLPLV